MEELSKRIELSMRVGKLDSLFLVIPTVFGVAFALLQYYFKTMGESWIIILVPILVVSVGYPIYIGYYRGAIKLNSIVERARGWIYVLNGLLIYILWVALRFVQENLPLFYSILPNIGFAFAFVGIEYYMSTWLGRRIVSLFGNEYSVEHKEIFRATGSSAGYLVIMLVIAIYIRESWVAGVAILLILFSHIIAESHARKLVLRLQKHQSRKL